MLNATFTVLWASADSRPLPIPLLFIFSFLWPYRPFVSELRPFALSKSLIQRNFERLIAMATKYDYGWIRTEFLRFRK